MAALRLNNPEKTAAILERLEPPILIDPSAWIHMLLESSQRGKSTNEPTVLDPLYDAFCSPDGNDRTALPAEPEMPQIPAAQAEILARTRQAHHSGKPGRPAFQRRRSICARAGHASGLRHPLRDLPTLTTAQKTAICENLNSPSAREAIALLTELLRDPVSEVRNAAAECALSNEKAKAADQSRAG